jgi:predicted dehydrogenase
MSEEPLSVAVVGAGNMGANHVRVYDELPETDLVEVVEPEPERAEEIRRQYDVRVLDDPSGISEAEAATVAVPNDYHRTVAESCLRQGLDILVEKPLAMSVEDAAAIVDAAEEHGAILQVGHIERFNPAVEMLDELLNNLEPIAFEAHRLGPFNEHLNDESVVFDLMVHDLDIIDSLVGGEIETLNALGASHRSTALDHALAQFKFDNGILGGVTASHVTHGKVRTLQVTTRESYISLDYQEQQIRIQRRGQEEATTLLGHSGYRTETVTETPYVQIREPLKNELEHFVDCVQTRSTPRVDGEAGINAIELATEALNLIRGSG